jgi:hypothetical protein
MANSDVDSEKGVSKLESPSDEKVAVEQVQPPATGFFSKVSDPYLPPFVFSKQSAFHHQLWQVVLYIDRFGVEVRGIERVSPDNRHAK